MEINNPKRKVSPNDVNFGQKRKRNVSVKYLIKTPRGNIPVCAATFQKITGELKLLFFKKCTYLIKLTFRCE